MRKQTPFTRLAGLAMAAVLCAPWVAPQASKDYKMEHFWSAQPKGQAWVSGSGECWQSLHGPGDLTPCASAPAAPPAPKKFTVRLNFEFDKYRIENVVNDDELRRLDDYIEQVKKSDVREKLSLTGHTDAKGSDAYNYRLGMRRAEAVRDYMISRGISPSDIVSVESRGESEMLPGVDIYSVQQRRVEIRAEY